MKPFSGSFTQMPSSRLMPLSAKAVTKAAGAGSVCTRGCTADARSTPSAWSQSATVADLDLRLSMGLVQTFPTYRTFQRISLDWGFGGASGDVAASGWQLDKAYLQRLKPSSGFQFAFGIRL